MFTNNSTSNWWKHWKLQEILNIFSGKQRPKIEWDFPVYWGNGILDYADRFNHENIIIVGRVWAYCGSVYYEKNKLWLSDNALWITNNENSDINYLYYLLLYLELNRNAIGWAQPLLTQGILNWIELFYPPLPEQQAIAPVLSSLDDKMELLREQNKTLESIAQTIFHEWFVKFNFPGATGEMEESELGEIPKGWRVGKLWDIVKLQRWLSYKWDFLSENVEDTPMINLWSFDVWWWYKDSWIKYYNGDFQPRHIRKSWDLLICNTDITQDRVILWSAILVPPYLWESVLFTHHIYWATMKTNFSKYYILYLLNTPRYRWVAETYANWTTVLNLPSDAITNFPILIPDKDTLDHFNELASSTFEKQEANKINIRELSKTRDTLLPKLMSGELRVKF